ncbi:MAG: XTP/dITP diphosphatase [candidate division Zixibacteria bacterium]|nr:XTP/dITP diphosphatase [candidate division Zixibacteria bacterium]
MTRIVLATRNKNKIKEIKEILKDLEVELLSLEDFPDSPEVKETGASLRENAILKARSAFDFTGLPSLADDSGIEVSALDGAPGVNSARFAGENCTYADNNRKLLSLLEGVPWKKRRATFVCVAVLALNNEEIVINEGKVFGYVADKEYGDQGFGYDPVFYFPPEKKTFGQMSASQKNQISHRAKAFLRTKKVIRQRLLGS